MAPLNARLYKELENKFGEVTIADEGCGMLADYNTDFNGRCVLQPQSPGEYYRINCPFCSDTRQRLWINHRWGVYDKKTKNQNHFLAICYNEHCLTDPVNRDELVRLTTWYGRRARAKRVEVLQGHVPAANEPIELPSDFVALHELPEDHLACNYLLQRKFNPAALAKKWGIGFSHEACSWSRQGRIVIPIYHGLPPASECIGWQARAISSDDTPKYYTAQGLKKSRELYGLQHVSAEGPVVICEGPTDVWRIGTNAVALLGKTASTEQRRLICELFAGRPLVILLDADAREDAEKLLQQLITARQKSLIRRDMAPVVVGQLPVGHDPGDCKHTQLKKIINNALPEVQQPAAGEEE